MKRNAVGYFRVNMHVSICIHIYSRKIEKNFITEKRDKNFIVTFRKKKERKTSLFELGFPNRIRLYNLLFSRSGNFAPVVKLTK